MKKQYERQFDLQAARKSLSDIRARTEELKLDSNRLKEEILRFNESRSEQIYLAGFKRAIASLKCLDQYAIDNLAKYLDKDNEGFISISNFTSQINNALMGSSFRSNTNKWAK